MASKIYNIHLLQANLLDYYLLTSLELGHEWHFNHLAVYMQLKLAQRNVTFEPFATLDMLKRAKHLLAGEERNIQSTSHCDS